MALQKQTKQLIFSQGIDTKTTHELVPVGKLHSAQNIRFKQTGKISKKNGSTAFGTNINAGGGSLPPVRAAFSHLGGLYAVAPLTGTNRYGYTSPMSGPDSIWGWSPSQSRWSLMCSAACVTAKSTPVSWEDPNVTNATTAGYLDQDQGFVDSAYVNGYIIHAVSDVSTTTITATDAATEECVVSIRVSLSLPRVCVIGTRAIIVGYNGNDIVGYEFPTSTLPSMNTALSVINFAVGTFGGGVVLDAFVAPFNSNLYIAFSNTTGGTVINQYASVPSSGTATITNFTVIAEAAVKCIAIFGGESTYQKIYCAYTKSGTGTRVNIASMTLTGSSLLTATANESNAVVGATVVDGRSSPQILMLCEIPTTTAGGTAYNCVGWLGLNSTSVIGTIGLASGNQHFNCHLASKIYVNNGIPYVILLNADASERTYYLCALRQWSTTAGTQFLPVAKLLFGVAGWPGSSTNSKGHVPNLVAGTTYVYSMGYLYQQKKTPTNSQYGAVRLTFNFNFTNPEAYQHRQLMGVTYFTGGIPALFDGKAFFEAAFLASPPQSPNPVASTGAAVLTTVSTYQFCYTYEFTDAAGNRHQSAPSVPVSVTLTGTQNRASVEIIGPTFTWHRIVQIVLWRTTANGTIFYRDTTSLGYPTSMVTAINASLDDTTLSQQEILYTQGNVVENQCPTACRGITIWKGRLWLLTDDGIVFSKTITDGFPATFNPIFNLNTLINKTEPKAMAACRDKLIAFYADDIYYTSGDGPSDTGDGAFTDLEISHTGIGCVSATAVCETRDMVLFQSRDGWRTIDGSLTVDYIGAELQAFVTENTTTYFALYLDNMHEVRISDGSLTYIYDTFEKQWSIATSWIDVNAVFWNGLTSSTKKYVRVQSDGTILYEDTSTFLDQGSFTGMTIRTGWITMDQFLGFERLYKVLILGRYFTPNTLTVRVYYDYMPQVVETFTYSSSAGTFASYTDNDVYAGNSFAGNGYPFEISLRPSQQKCQAIRLEISDSFVSGNGQAIELLGMNLVLGVRNVDAKIRDAATATGSGKGSFIP